MKNSRRNIPDPVSPQNPLNRTDIKNDRIQDHLEEKTSMEDIFRDENELTRYGTQDQKRGRRTPEAGTDRRKRKSGSDL